MKKEGRRSSGSAGPGENMEVLPGSPGQGQGVPSPAKEEVVEVQDGMGCTGTGTGVGKGERPGSPPGVVPDGPPLFILDIAAAEEDQRADTYTHDHTHTAHNTSHKENPPEKNPKRNRPPKDSELDSESSTSTMTWKKRISSWVGTEFAEKVPKVPEIMESGVSQIALPRLTTFTDALRRELQKNEVPDVFQGMLGF